MVHVTSRPLYLRERVRCPFNRGMCGLQSRSGRFQEEEELLRDERIQSPDRPARSLVTSSLLHYHTYCLILLFLSCVLLFYFFFYMYACYCLCIAFDFVIGH